METAFLNKIKPVFFYLWFIAVVAGLMVCLLWAVYLIPVEKIKDNVRKYPPHQIRQESIIPLNFYGFPIDGFTDALILNNTLLKRRNGLHTAMLNPRVEINFLDQIGNLQIALNPYKVDHLEFINYPRFWHGYLIFLKPLFYWLDLQQICFLNLFFQTLLLLSALYLMYKKLGFKHCLSFLCGIFILNPITTWQCLEYANVINIMLLSVLWVLLNKNPNDKYMFFVIGAVTILFDFLTFPLITLGIPLIIYILLYERNFKDNIKCVIKNSFLWGIGYVLMLASKWGIATFITGENVIWDGWHNVLHRTYCFGELMLPSRVLESLFVNLDVIWNFWTIIMFSVFFVLICINCFVCSLKFRFKLQALVLFGISFMPFVWYSVLVNHSIIHPHWTYKILAITIYAILSAIVCCLQPKEVLKRKKK